MKIPILLGLMVLTALPILAIDAQRDVIQPAQALLGSGYCRQSTGPTCFDCSGFVTYLYRDLVDGLPRVSRDMARFGTAIDRDDLEPGDLVFFATGSRPDQVTHVAIYMGQNSIIHAISDGPNRGVTITELSARYWRTRYYAARRVLPTEPAGSGPSGTAGHTDGEITFARGTYSGELLGGEPHGNGRLVMNNDDNYEGQFRNGFFDGDGTYTWADGSRYAGSFRDGRLHGNGTYTPAGGIAVSGTWNKGELLQRTVSAPPATYFDVKDSPWETFDGIVTGDFSAWLQEEQDAFEEWKQEN